MTDSPHTIVVLCPCNFKVESFMFVDQDPEIDATFYEAYCMNCMRCISVAISEDKMLGSESNASPRSKRPRVRKESN